MIKQLSREQNQQGFLLIEGLMAILIFAFGILGIVAMGAKAVSAQSDAEYRTKAADLAEQIANTISLSIDRSKTSVPISSQIDSFAYNGTTSNVVVQAWLNKVNDATTGLPGASALAHTIVIQDKDASTSLVTVTVAWRSPADLVARGHTFSTYITY